MSAVAIAYIAASSSPPLKLLSAHKIKRQLFGEYGPLASILSMLGENRLAEPRIVPSSFWRKKAFRILCNSCVVSLCFKVCEYVLHGREAVNAH